METKISKKRRSEIYSKTARARISEPHSTDSDSESEISFKENSKIQKWESNKLTPNLQKIQILDQIAIVNTFEKNISTPISKIEFNHQNSPSIYTSEENIVKTPSKSKTDASNFISPYTSQLLKKHPNSNFYTSNTKKNEKSFYEENQYQIEFNGFSDDMSPGVITKCKIKSLMRDETQRNMTPEDGIIGADTMSHVNQSQIQANWMAMGRENTTENEYVLRRTQSLFYCDPEDTSNLTSMDYPDESFATFINICEQKVKKMVRLDIEKKVNFLSLRGNFQIDKDSRKRPMEFGVRGVRGNKDLGLKVMRYYEEELRVDLKENLEKVDNKKIRLKRGERSGQCLSRISMYGFKKPAKIFTSFHKRRGFCAAKCDQDNASKVEKNPFLNEENFGEIEVKRKSQKSCSSNPRRITCEKNKKKLVKFLRENNQMIGFNYHKKLEKSKTTTNSSKNIFQEKNNFSNYTNIREDSFKENKYRQNYNSCTNILDAYKVDENLKIGLNEVEINKKDEKLEDNFKKKINFRNKNQMSYLTNKGYNHNFKSQNESQASSSVMKPSPSHSNLENDNKKMFCENFINKSCKRTTLNNNKKNKKKLYKVQSSMLVSGSKIKNKMKNEFKGSSRNLRSFARYSSSKNLNSNQSIKDKISTSYIKLTQSKRNNFLENRTEKFEKLKKSERLPSSRKIRRSSFLQSIEKIGVDNNIKDLTNSVKRMEKSMSKSPEKTNEGEKIRKTKQTKKKNFGFYDKEKFKFLSSEKYAGFMSNRDQKIGYYEVNFESYEKNEKKAPKKNLNFCGDNSLRNKENVFLKPTSPNMKKYYENGKNFFDSGTKNQSGGKVYVGDKYVNVKDIVKYHIADGIGKKKLKSSSSLLDKISKLKSFRGV